MESHGERAAAAVPETLDRELNMVRAAIDLVASGGSARVVLAGLRLLDAVMAEASDTARRAGVRLVPVWTAAEQVADLAVERETP